MSGRLVKDVLRYAPTDLTDKERLVLIALAEDARDKDRIARFITIDELAEIAQISTGTVRNIISRLSARALIQPTLSHASKSHRQQYRIAFLTQEHRTATVRDSKPKASPSGVTLTAVANGYEESLLEMTQTPVDNSEPDSQSVIEDAPKRHRWG